MSFSLRTVLANGRPCAVFQITWSRMSRSSRPAFRESIRAIPSAEGTRQASTATTKASTNGRTTIALAESARVCCDDFTLQNIKECCWIWKELPQSRHLTVDCAPDTTVSQLNTPLSREVEGDGPMKPGNPPRRARVRTL